MNETTKYEYKEYVSRSGKTKRIHIFFKFPDSPKRYLSYLLMKSEFEKSDQCAANAANRKREQRRQSRKNYKFLKNEKKRLNGKMICAYCGKNVIVQWGKNTPETASVDHFLPRSIIDDTHNTDNFIVACRKCNQDKKNHIYPIQSLKFIEKDRLIKVMFFIWREIKLGLIDKIRKEQENVDIQ